MGARIRAKRAEQSAETKAKRRERLQSWGEVLGLFLSVFCRLLPPSFFLCSPTFALCQPSTPFVCCRTHTVRVLFSRRVQLSTLWWDRGGRCSSPARLAILIHLSILITPTTSVFTRIRPALIALLLLFASLFVE